MISSSDAEKDKLLSSFFKAVKECQIRFGGHTELATEEDTSIVNLCQVLESILKHGLKAHAPNRGNNTIQHMRNIVSSSLNFQNAVGNTELDNAVVWWFIRELLTQHEYHRFLRLKNVVTDVGRTRAWIRSLLNEHSLERYIHIILSETEMLNMWFEPWALFRNQEKASVLPNLAAGLDTILFAINIDNEAFNCDGNKMINPVRKNEVGGNVSKEEYVATLAKSDSQESAESINQTENKKRKKRIASQVISFDEENSVKCSPTRVRELDNMDDSSLNVIEVVNISSTMNVLDTDSNVLYREKSSADQHFSYDDVLQAVYVSDSNDSILKTKDDAPAKPSRHGIESLKPISGAEFDLIPLSPDGEVNEFYIPADSMSLKSYQDDNETAAEAKDMSCRKNSTINVSAASDLSFSSFTMEELRTAVLEISRSRDAAEERRNDSVDLLAKQSESLAIMKTQALHDKTTNASTIECLSANVKSLSRENELLRHQLKKYISAVQMLRRGESNTGDPYDEKVLPKNGPDLRDYHDEALAYESKLIQVAEMHGELMEFNERLQKLLRLRESQVHQLRDELVDLRGPFPQQPSAEVYDDAISIASDLDSVAAHRTLINVWIPTAFLAGPASDTHHVYQIYIRIKENEWNVYRRFAQFFEVHSSWKKKFNIVKTFDFPKKKTFGYKDTGVVEDRRIRLQEYLRKLINLLVREYSDIATEPCKSWLIEKIPFLIDPPNRQVDSSQQNRMQLFSRLTSTRNDQIAPNSPQYNGL